MKRIDVICTAIECVYGLVAAIAVGLIMTFGIAIAQTEPALYEPEPTDAFRLGPCVSLFNGESGTITGQYYALTANAAHTGGYGFVSTGTTQLIPRVRHNTIDLTRFDEVWLWMRATQKECDVQITGRSYKGDTQTKTQHLTTEWQLVRLVVTNLDAGNGTLSVLNEWILKPVVADGILPQFQMDDMWAVKLLPPSETPTPDPADPGNTDPDPVDPPPITYGDWIPQPIITELVFKSVGDDGSERTYTRAITITIGEPVITTTPAPEVGP